MTVMVWCKLDAGTESVARSGAPERTENRTKQVPESGNKNELKTGTPHVHNYNFNTRKLGTKKQNQNGTHLWVSFWYPFLGTVLVPIPGRNRRKVCFATGTRTRFKSSSGRRDASLVGSLRKPNRQRWCNFCANLNLPGADGLAGHWLQPVVGSVSLAGWLR